MWRPAALVTAGLLIGYLPLWRAFFHEIHVGAKPASSLVSHVLSGAYNLYCLFVSESIAPWVWGLNLSVAAAIAISLAILCFYGPRPALRYAAFFLFVLAIMSAMGIVTTKRIMLIAPWLLLRLALPSHLGAGSRKTSRNGRQPPRMN